MRELQCPGCGAGIKFKSRHSVFGVCTYCDSTLALQGDAVEGLGKMAKLAPDMSVLQIGTCGVFEKKKFELIGHARFDWGDGYWNEWYAAFPGDTYGWLAEAQGQYMVSFEVEPARDLVTRRKIKEGDDVGVGSVRYVVDDVKKAKCVGAEGELPSVSTTDSEVVTADLSDGRSGFANLIISPDDKNRLFVGRYVEYDELNLTNTRTPDGW